MIEHNIHPCSTHARVRLLSILIKNAIIVTVNSRDEILQNGSIIIEGSRIKDIGSAEDIARKYSVNEEIDASGMVAMPGLINGHIHTITALYKGTMVGFGFEKCWRGHRPSLQCDTRDYVSCLAFGCDRDVAFWHYAS